MKRKMFFALVYLCLSLVLACTISLIIAKLYDFAIIEVLFWVGLVVVSLGCLASIGGDATEIRRFDGTVDGQYQSFANFYKNFMKHGVFDPKVSGISIIFAGTLLILISYFLG